MNKYNQDTKRFQAITKAIKKCKCGHTQLVGMRDRTICSQCGHFIYKDDKIEFKYKLKAIKLN